MATKSYLSGDIKYALKKSSLGRSNVDPSRVFKLGVGHFDSSRAKF